MSATSLSQSSDGRRILVVGGGYVGLHVAHRLQKRLRPGEATVVVVDPQPNMTYQPFLPEAAAGSIEARHLVVPLRQVLRRCRVLTGSVIDLEHERRVATVCPIGGDPFELSYDVLVLAAGSVARTQPVPGLTQHAVGFKTLGEAIYLRNHLLSQLDLASTTSDPAACRRALTTVFVGGGYAGVEALGELEDMVRYALRFHPELDVRDLRWVLVEGAGRILPEVSEGLAEYAARQLDERGIELRFHTRVQSMLDGRVVLTDGTSLEAGTIVWTAGVTANPLASRAGFPVDPQGRLRCTPELRVEGVQDAWSAGDCALVPDLSNDDDPAAVCAPTAQHAVRQARRLADNVLADLRWRPARPYRHRYVGSVASLGLHKGVAEVYGLRLRGWPAWFMHRTYHMSRMPTFNRKVRLIADWTLALLFRREVVSLGQIQEPRRELELAVEHEPERVRVVA